MQTAFSRPYVAVRLGGRALALGPVQLHLGGGEYSVSPLSFQRVLELAALVGSPSWGWTGAGPLPLSRLAAVGADALRALAPLLIGEPIRPRDLSRASPRQLVALAAAVESVNDWAAIAEATAPAPAGADAGGGNASGGMAQALIAIGERWKLWPSELLALPYGEVMAVLDEMARQAGAAGNGGSANLPISDAEAAWVRAQTAALQEH